MCRDTTQESKLVNFDGDTTISLGDINCFARLKPILKLYEEASRSKMNISKSWASWPGTYEIRTDKLGMMMWS